MTEPSFAVIVNGEVRQICGPSVAEVIEELGLPATTVLVEHNGEALRRSEWKDRTVREGDRFEILRVAAGG
jgi:thiamine biosynthesis protein ThiS